MQIDQMTEKQNHHPDHHAMTYTGTRPAKEGAMRLVRGPPSSPHDYPTEGGPGHWPVGREGALRLPQRGWRCGGRRGLLLCCRSQGSWTVRREKAQARLRGNPRPPPPKCMNFVHGASSRNITANLSTVFICAISMCSKHFV